MSRINEGLKRAAVWHGDTCEPQPAGDPLDPTRADAILSRDGPSEEEPDLMRVPDVWAVRAVAAPRTVTRGQQRPFSPALDAKLIVHENADPICVEQFRRLAGTLYEIQVERGLKTLMVTSSVPHEGKTLTIANLALTLSESYACRVLLVDADLRRPAVHEVFGLPNAAGLGDVLRSGRPELPLLQVSKGLSVLPAGRPDPNPMAALTSDRMRTLLEQSAAEFDWVLLDGPPVGLMPDARLLAAATRAVLFVIGAGTTPYVLVKKAIAELGPECIVGTVLNRVDPQNEPAAAYYHHYYTDPVSGARTAD